MNKSANLKVKYELLKNNSNYYFDFNSIAFNGSHILVAANLEQIVVYEFKAGTMKKIQTINTETIVIGFLVFMKKSNKFVTGGFDNMIRLWGSRENNLFYHQQLFKGGHSNYIYCITMNRAENLIISASADKKIKFWKLKIDWVCSYTLKNHCDRVFSISLSENEAKLVSCGSNNIIISCPIENDRWIMIQRIQVVNYGLSVCFIDDHEFIYQSLKQNKLEVFSFDEKSQLYIKSNDTQLNQGSPKQLQIFTPIFNKEMNLLLHKWNDSIYLIRRNENIFFTIEQCINLGTESMQISLTTDWKYLMTLDSISMMLQMWKLT